MTQSILKLLLMFLFKICYSKKKRSASSSHNSVYLNRKDGKKYQGQKSDGCNTDSTYINSFYEQS